MVKFGDLRPFWKSYELPTSSKDGELLEQVVVCFWKWILL
jgi:hypothetical protein